MKTHNNTIETNEIMQPDYVLFDCAAWNVPDNTIGKVGKHVVYRPLCDGYNGHEYLTDAMRQAVREHYDICEGIENVDFEDEIEAETITESNNKPCPKCGTWCYGDCGF